MILVWLSLFNSKWGSFRVEGKGGQEEEEEERSVTAQRILLFVLPTPHVLTPTPTT